MKTLKHYLTLLITVSIICGGLISANSALAALAPLYRLFEIKNVGADIVLVVDTSLSMKESFPVVRKALNNFSRALEPNDRLTIVVFSNDAKKVYSGSVKDSAAIRRALPKAPDPQGKRTSMGAAIELVLKELKSADDRLPVVLFLTDGVDDPPPESNFARQREQAWSALRNQSQERFGRRQPNVYGIGLNQQTDINQLKQIWPGAQPITVNPSKLSVYFVELKEKIRQERLRHELLKELADGKIKISVERANWGELRPGTVSTEKVRIKSTYKRLPVSIEVRGGSWSDFKSLSRGRSPKRKLPRKLNVDRKVLLGPGESKVVPIEVRMPRQSREFKLRSDEQYKGRIQLDLRASPKYSGEISKLGVGKKIKITGGRQSIWFSRPIGLSFYIFAALIFAALTALVAFNRFAVTPVGQLIYRKFVPPPLFGRLAFSGAPAGEQLPRPISLDDLGRRVTIGTSGKLNLRGGDIKGVHAEIFTRWVDGEPKVMLSQREGNARVSAPGKSPRLANEPVELAPGSIIHIGDYKIQWI